MTGRNVFVAGGFSAIPSRTIRFLEEASRLGSLHVLLWAVESDANTRGGPVTLTLPERHYILAHDRYVSTVTVTEDGAGRSGLPLHTGMRPDVWAVEEWNDLSSRRDFCRVHGIEYRVIRSAELRGFPSVPPPSRHSGRKKVVVTGCFDWFHSGHVRFFEEASAYGDLYVVVGSDSNLRLLKGEGHPLFPQEERRYLVQSVRFVTQALISTGSGWMDAEPEIERIRPDIYLVNEDGDQPEKRDFCKQHGLEYVVLTREPKPGLPPRRSTDLRGF
jgi:cytidyltransferase-like protein